MDFMFEDEVDEVGSDVEAYCPKCKGDTTHVVISKYEDEIRRVQCNPCGDVHSYRKPRGDAEDDVPEPVAARKRAMMKKLTWDEFFAKHGEKDARPYEFREPYRENHIVFHPKFGKGFVSEVVSESKVEITFADARRVLVHNRRDIAGLPLVSEGDGTPTPPPPPVREAKERDNHHREHKAERDSHREHREPKEHREAKEPKEHREVKEPKEHREAKEPKEHREAKEPKEHREAKDAHGHAHRDKEHHHKEKEKVAPKQPVKAVKPLPPPPPAPVASKAKPPAKPERKAAEKGDKASGTKSKTAKPARATVSKAAPKKKMAARKK